MKKRIYYFDMDGVIFDFDLHYSNLLGPRLENEEADWERLYRDHPDFFSTMPVMEGFYRLWNIIPEDSRYILSAIAKKVDNCSEQKKEALRKNFSIEDEKIILVRGRQNKVKYCRPGYVLIDDRGDNIQDWNNAGGFGILFKSVD